MTTERMRRRVGPPVTGALLLLLSFGSPATAAGARSVAFASWAGSSGLSYALASEPPSGQGDSVGTLGTIECGGGRACIGASFTRVLAPDAFSMDPGMNEASLEMLWGRAEQVVAWTGDGDYAADSDPDSFHADVSREADSEGTIFAHEHAGDPDQSFLSQEADGEAESPVLVGYSVEDGPRFVGPGDGLLDDAKDACITFKNSERGFARRMNAERAEKDRSKLRLDPELGRIARRHTRDMIDADLLYHTDQKDLITWVVGWKLLGENVGVGNTVDSLHDAFMHSPPHRKNILYADFERFGVGTARADERLWVTVIFQAGVNPETTLKCD